MIIDFHTHVFPEKIAAATIEKLEAMAHIKACGDGTLTSLLNSMEQNRIDLSIVLPVVTNPKQFQKINESAVKMNEENPGKIISFGGIHPDSADYKSDLRRIRDMGLRGIKLHPDYQNADFNDIRYKRIVSYATELGLIISVHAGYDIGIGDPVHCTPAMSLEVIQDTAPDRLVLAHTGGFNEWDDVERYLVGQNVYFDLSYSLGFISEEQLIRIIQNHGDRKILYATDFPWGNQSASVRTIEKLDISPTAKENIFSGNALRLLQIEKQK